MTTLPLHLGHEFLLLYLEEGFGKGRVDQVCQEQGYVGAVLAQWLFEGRLGPTKAHYYALRPANNAFASGASITIAAECVKPNPAKLLAIQRQIVGWSPKTRVKPALEELKEAGLLDRQEDSFLGIFTWRVRWPEVNGEVERALVERLKTHIKTVEPGSAPTKDDALIGMLRATKLLNAVWNDSELAEVREKLNKRTDTVPLGKMVYQEIQNAYAAAAVAASS